METRQYDTDLIVIGGGPAGSATAIACAARGLRVRLFERDVFSGERPGDTLHPGIEPLLGQLGIDAGRLAGVTGARHEGVWIDWNGRRRFEPFGADADGPWRGFQVRRTAFDAMLLARAAEAGAEVVQPCAVSALLFDDDDDDADGTVRGVMTAGGAVTARLVIDASGRGQWLARQLDIGSERRSPRLIARYGYADGSHPPRDAAPQMCGGRDGWTWTAMVRPGTYQWTRVALDGGPTPADSMPAELRHLAPKGPSRGADVTWRIAAEVARPGWFMVGDAAAVLDPTSSHGVLKALMSGITAAQLAGAVLLDGAPQADAAAAYQEWLADWFESDVEKLSGFYAELGLDGFG